MRAKDKIKVLKRLLANEEQSEPAFVLYAIDELLEANVYQYSLVAHSAALTMLKVASKGIGK